MVVRVELVDTSKRAVVNTDDTLVFEVERVSVLDVNSADSLGPTVADKSSVSAVLDSVSVRPSVEHVSRRADSLEVAVTHLSVDVDNSGAVTSPDLANVHHVTKDFTITGFDVTSDSNYPANK